MNNSFQIEFDGFPVTYDFLFQWTHLQFGSYYLHPSERVPDIRINKEFINKIRHIFSETAWQNRTIQSGEKVPQQ